MRFELVGFDMRALVLAVIIASTLSGCAEPGPRSYDLEDAVISGRLFPRLVVEVDYPSDMPPSSFAIKELERTIRAVTTKDRVEVLLTPYEPGQIPARDVWTDGSYLDAHRRLFDSAGPLVWSKGDAALLHVLYLHGQSPRGAAGLVHGNLIVVFPEAFRPDFSLPELSSPSTAQKVEAAILVHELGHVLGLVNGGAPMIRPREDPDAPHHSTNSGSVMQAKVETNELYLSSESRRLELPDVIMTFDEDDLADLRALVASIEGPS